MCICMRLYVCLYIYKCVYVYTCVYLCVCGCVYLNIDTYMNICGTGRDDTLNIQVHIHSCRTDIGARFMVISIRVNTEVY